jgi:hypothetical protein
VVFFRGLAWGLSHDGFDRRLLDGFRTFEVRVAGDIWLGAITRAEVVRLGSTIAEESEAGEAEQHHRPGRGLWRQDDGGVAVSGMGARPIERHIHI